MGKTTDSHGLEIGTGNDPVYIDLINEKLFEITVKLDA